MAFPRPAPQSAKNAETRALRRSLLLAGIFGVWAACLVARLYYLQIIQYVDLLHRAEKQQQRIIEVKPNRGTIHDRNMFPLAMSVERDSIYAVPPEIASRDMTARLLAQTLGLDAAEVLERFLKAKMFCWVKRTVPDDESARVRALHLKGVYFQKEMKRVYPKGDLAGHILGTVGVDDKGLAGLEYSLNDAIQGRPGKVLIATDAHRQSFLSEGAEGVPGKTVVLTLDENIQYIAQRALADAVERWHAAGGTVIVQNPNTGEILAMASDPPINPNDFTKSRLEDRVNQAIGWVYEPGSTFKIVTVSAALEERLATPQQVVDCQMGSIVLANHVIHDHQRFGALSVEKVLVHSSDVGAIKLGLRLGDDRFYRYVKRFGFGAKTDVDLPGEERGLLKPPQQWSGITIGEMSIGQEVGVTPLQLVTAYSAIANGGILFQPRIVHDIFRDDVQDRIPPSTGRRIVSEKTAAEMKQMLRRVVEEGTGRPAELNGYSAGGKTGTAQKIDASGHYSKSHYIASFVGFAPVPQPAVTILVVIDSPVGAIYGGDVSAPVFKSVAEQVLSYLGVPQDAPAKTPPALVASAKSGRVAVVRKEESENDLPADIETLGGAEPALQAVSLTTLAPPLSPGTVVMDNTPLITVPNFSGMSVRQVAEKCEELGLDPTLLGSGLATEQSPIAGSEVHAHSRIVVRFGR